ncbi:unnamed protein product [Rotaria sp. Silwood2]|nr:unnamed protein product [Rotaria sp. Silwood2]CAF2487766.1 unnamed protein product [Rotaria sp. Silwood2]CAF2718635.1 unnamed protein product [Rotaria sp. Silwood2]CAF2887386.1 unnamed protein product [Rotaria sp. Silwood2]CAF4058471.1 unnamed protein product [Rotaria sp. Silwood2]
MGNRVNRPRFIEWDLDHLEKITTLSKQQYLNLYDQYQNDEAWGGQNMDDKLFFQKYDEMLPGEQTKAESDRAFHTFDYNNSGKLSFEEFVGVVVVLNNGSTTFDRIKYLIDQYNPTKGDNHIRKDFGKLIFERLNKYYGINNVDPASAWSELVGSSEGNTDQVSCGKFFAFINGHPVYGTYIQQ